eukprot:CAMPEP_0170560238 /NCGR_PEP_ID=MMETSP0211-20121228/47628_1 /TAXON_ID=311385 /ORGANISM="Pseudokeronopsis sp., Strain OXSARD2" /LENGTH=55 /DNA_ID=CAMNT_0010874171 /DNA_START=22 /DNA_END=186 /DNA_ORIENTATION=-
MKSTKFIKRLLSFFMPQKKLFITLDWKEDNLIYSKVGYNLIKFLLNFKDGRKALT